MEESTSYTTDLSEIHVQKMRLTVTHRRPEDLKKPLSLLRREAEVQLYQIFRKYT